MIDWRKAEELRSEVGAKDFPEVFELFVAEVETAIARLRPGLPDAAIENDMHFIKGSAWNLGFTALGELCQSGERCARDGNAQSVDLDAVRLCYIDSKAEFIRLSALNGYLTATA